MTVPVIVPATSLVATLNVALVAPAGTMTLAGTVSGSPAVSVTSAPPAGAGAVRRAVPVTEFPPTTLAALNETVERAIRVTVKADDWPLLPLREAVTLAVPAPTPVTVNVAVDDPAGTVSDDCTVATAGLLLVRARLVATDGAAASVTVPWRVLPIPMVAAANATVVTVGLVVEGEAGELEPPHRLAATAANTIQVQTMKTLRRRDWLIPRW